MYPPLVLNTRFQSHFLPFFTYKKIDLAEVPFLSQFHFLPLPKALLPWPLMCILFVKVSK